MRVQKSSKAALFLIELIIAIVFFALASAICVQLFAKAHTLSTGSRDLSTAINIAQTAAETFKTQGEVAWLEPGEMQGVYTAYYDDSGTATQEAQGRYRLQMACGSFEDMNTADISVYRTDTGDELYAITAKKYAPGQ